MITDPSCSVVLVAGAGTGKTWQLVRRYLKIVALGGVSPHQVAAVTFTRAAAGEMRERLIAALRTHAPDPEDKIVIELLEHTTESEREALIGDLAGAPIDTLHGLCGRLLGRFPELAGLDPDPRPLEPGEDTVLARRFVSGFLDGMLADVETAGGDGAVGPDTDANTAPSEDLVALLADYPFEAIRATVILMVDDADGPPASWGDGAAVHQARSQAHQAILDHALGAVRAALPGAAAAEQDAAGRGARKHHEERLERIQQLQEALTGRGEVDAALKRIAGLRSTQDLPDFIEFIDLCKAAAAHRDLRFDLDTALDETHSHRLARLVRLGRATRAAYARHLGDKGLLRFDDLETRTLALLQAPEAEASLRGLFRHILVDEFQDTNRRQLAILDALARHCAEPAVGASQAAGVKTFYVGDPKQSIYRFRGAEVSVFEAEVKRAGRRGELAHLRETRRTSRPLARALNQVFERLLDVPYDPLARVPWDESIYALRRDPGLEPSAFPASAPGHTAPVHLCIRGSNDPIDEDPIDEVDRIAGWIRGRLDHGRLWDAGLESHRPIRPGDIAVLLPRWTRSDELRAALERVGVTAEPKGGRGLLDLPEVNDLINLVHFLAAWDDELAAAAVLRGPAFAISDLGLYVLARWPGVVHAHDGSPWDPPTLAAGGWPRRYPRSLRRVALAGALEPVAALDALAAAGLLDPADRPALHAQLVADAASLEAGRRTLDALSGLAGAQLTADLLARAITEFRLEAHWLASSRGRRAVANAWRFVEHVRAVEASGPAPTAVLEWMRAEPKVEPVGAISGAADAVSITTTYKAKGLEWPIVVLAELQSCGHKPDREDWRAGAVPLPGAGEVWLARAYRPGDGFQKRKDELGHNATVLLHPLEVAETKRLLYVGLTRARDQVLLSASAKGAAPRGISDAKTALDFVRASFGLGNVDAPAPDPALAPLLYFVQDADLDTMGRAAPTAPAPPAPDLEAMGRFPTGSVQVIRPSAGPTAEEARKLTWQVHLPVLAPVAVPDDKDPRDLGSLLHAVMELWNFNGPPPSADRVAQLAERVFPTAAHHRGEPEGQRHARWVCACIERMRADPVCDELIAAARRQRVFHEVHLDVMLSPTQRVTGTIDLLWQGPGDRWHLLDYKATTKISSTEKLRELQANYGPQLLRYRRALEVLYGADALGRFGLWLAPSGAPMWVDRFLV